MALEGLLFGSGREGFLQNDKAGQPIYSGSAGFFEEWMFRVLAKWDALAGSKAEEGQQAGGAGLEGSGRAEGRRDEDCDGPRAHRADHGGRDTQACR